MNRFKPPNPPPPAIPKYHLEHKLEPKPEPMEVNELHESITRTGIFRVWNKWKRGKMMSGRTILIIVLVLLCLGAFGGGGLGWYGTGNYYGYGGGGILLLILIVLLVMGRV